MPTLRDIRKRLKAIQNTKKITAAMKMVAAAKLRKVQDRMLNFRPYAIRMESVLSDLAKVAEREIHPLFVLRPRKTIEVIVMTSDRGLCGGFNTNILKFAANYMNTTKKEGIEVSLSIIGRKSRDYFRRRNVPMRKSWIGLSGRITYTNAQEIANDLIENYTNETIDEVVLIYSEFKSLLVQKPTMKKLLPIGLLEIEESQKEGSLLSGDFLYEPSMETIFEKLLPKNIEIQIYRALLETSASEEAARMTAMENATKNCGELITKVTLLANKVRQASITKELMDIVGGVEALK
ncbi:MAG: ATP synthase F1 subunit gamma [Nitrospira sp.]|jgi:F-type H+-transporting ATPase subunit gamma|nr:ATP synthase F1 subunit gamma [Nitrospira sp.]